MSEGKRPGGLTALAIINFILTSLSLIALLGLVVTYSDLIPTEHLTEEERAPIDAIQNMSLLFFVITLTLSLIVNVLSILSGIGYLGQKKVLGWLFGNIYAVFAIANTTIATFILLPDSYGGFRMITMIDLLYPILTIILINTTFKDDLIN